MKKTLNSSSNLGKWISFIPKWCYLAFFLILVTVNYLSTSNEEFNWIDSSTYKDVINSDASGYYAYLPQYFIYQTKEFGYIHQLKEENPEYSKINQGINFEEKGGESINFDKYFIGTSICMMPTFLAVNQWAKNSNYSQDGYSYPYQIGIAISAFIFLIIGVVFLYFFLIQLGVNTFTALASVALLTFATNLKYYTLFEPGMSHVYSFAVISCFLFYALKYAKQEKEKYLLGIFITLGLLTIIRPTNFLIVLFLPFLYSSWKDFTKAVLGLFKKEKLIWSIAALSFFILILSIQFINVYRQFGIFRFNGYTSEGFDNLLTPEIANVLFSFRKGLFVYTPALILPILGLIFLYKKNRFQFFGWIMLFGVFTYITSSWWNWYYGGGLGMRPYVDICSFMIIPFALAFQGIKKIFKFIFILLIGLFSWHNSVQTYQMKHAIYHYSNMDYESYKTVFLRKGLRFKWALFQDSPLMDNDVSKINKTLYYHYDKVDWDENKSEIIVEGGHRPILKSNDSHILQSSRIVYEGAAYLKDIDTKSLIYIYKYIDGKPIEIQGYNYLFQIWSEKKWTDFKVILDLKPDLKADSIEIEITSYNEDLLLKDVQLSFGE